MIGRGLYGLYLKVVVVILAHIPLVTLTQREGGESSVALPKAA